MSRDPTETASSWVSRKSTAFARLALELASELYLYEREGRSPQDILELQLEWLTASMKVVRLEIAEAVVVPSMLRLTPSQLQQRLEQIQTTLTSTSRSLLAYRVPSSSSTPASEKSSSEINTETSQASDS